MRKSFFFLLSRASHNPPLLMTLANVLGCTWTHVTGGLKLSCCHCCHACRSPTPALVWAEVWPSGGSSCDRRLLLLSCAPRKDRI